jgi:hypothetical protein
MRSSHFGIRCGTGSTGRRTGSGLPSGSGKGAGLIASVVDVDSGCCDILFDTRAAPAAKDFADKHKHKPDNQRSGLGTP